LTDTALNTRVSAWSATSEIVVETTEGLLSKTQQAKHMYCFWCFCFSDV